MKPVSEEVVENVLKRMEDIEEEDIPKLIEEMGKEQPIVLAYLLAYGEEMDEDDQGFLIFLGLNIWQMMSEGDHSPAKVSEELLEELEDKNIKMVESQAEESEDNLWNFSERLVNDYNQRNILMYVLGEIMEESEDEGAIQEENIGIFMLCLMTVIDCLDKDHLSWVV